MYNYIYIYTHIILSFVSTCYYILKSTACDNPRDLGFHIFKSRQCTPSGEMPKKINFFFYDTYTYTSLKEIFKWNEVLLPRNFNCKMHDIKTRALINAVNIIL